MGFIDEKLLIFDGGCGSGFQAMGLEAEDFGGAELQGCNEQLNLSAPEVIGRVLAWADERGVPTFRQDASPVKVRVTKDRLRENGGWIRSQPHARDALRHLLYREEKAGEVSLD